MVRNGLSIKIEMQRKDDYPGHQKASAYSIASSRRVWETGAHSMLDPKLMQGNLSTEWVSVMNELNTSQTGTHSR